MPLPARSRPHYVSDGVLPAKGGPVLTGGALLAAIAVAWLLNWFFQRQWYLVILVPSVAAFLVGLLIAGLVAIANCRQPKTAAIVGALAGLTRYMRRSDVASAQPIP